MKLVVFGATGGLGRAAASTAAARGDQVTAFARQPGRLHLASSVRVVEGDALDAEAVAGAIAGQDAVLSALGGRPWRDREVCAQGTRNIVDAMRRQGVRRLVVVSSLGVGDSRERLGWLVRKVAAPLVMRRSFQDKERMEEVVRATDLDWIIVRPGLLTGGRPSGRWRATVDEPIQVGFITRADAAAFCLVQLSSDEYLRKCPSIA
jgi:putative NADH-flavin reductase